MQKFQALPPVDDMLLTALHPDRNRCSADRGVADAGGRPEKEARRTADGNPERMLKMSEENKDPGIPKARILKSQIQKSQPPGSKIPKTKIKICGLSRMEDIEAVNEACPDYCGFIINYPPSKRNISVDQLAELKKILRKEMKAVGVFVDAPAESVAKLLNEDLIDLAQLHGNEDETYIANLKKLTAKPLIRHCF